MRRFQLSHDTGRILLAAIAIIGILAVVYAVVLFLNARNVIDQAPDIQAQIDQLSPEQAQAVFAAIPPTMLIKQRQALQDQNRSLIIGGIGLVVLGLAWLGYDFLNRRKPAEV